MTEVNDYSAMCYEIMDGLTQDFEYRISRDGKEWLIADSLCMSESGNYRLPSALIEFLNIESLQKLHAHKLVSGIPSDMYFSEEMFDFDMWLVRDSCCECGDNTYSADGYVWVGFGGSLCDNCRDDECIWFDVTINVATDYVVFMIEYENDTLYYINCNTHSSNYGKVLVAYAVHDPIQRYSALIDNIETLVQHIHSWFSETSHTDNYDRVENFLNTPLPQTYVSKDVRLYVSGTDAVTYKHMLENADKPAIITDNFEEWRINGKLHREPDADGTVGPAYTDKKTGYKAWYKNGDLHNENDPAVIYPNGDTMWYQNNKQHRIGGPAAILKGRKAWWVNGKRHCLTGPAIEDDDGREEYYVGGMKYTKAEFLKITAALKVPEVQEPKPKPETVEPKPEPEEEDYDTKKENYDIHGKLAYTTYKLRDKLHRLHGPAIEYVNGDEEWYRHGKHHRIGKPAIVDNNYEAWYEDGELHRLNGPAVIYYDGRKHYYIKGNMYSEEQFLKITSPATPPETPAETPETPVETPETTAETPETTVETPETTVETPTETRMVKEVFDMLFKRLGISTMYINTTTNTETIHNGKTTVTETKKTSKKYFKGDTQLLTTDIRKLIRTELAVYMNDKPN